MSKKDSIIDALIVPLGSGNQRDVFRLKSTNDIVIKVGRYSVSQNVIEFDLWAQWQYTEEGKRWLAACYELSDNGRVLTQERLTPIALGDPRLPDKMPRWITDTKVENFGVAKDGTVKCCDYGCAISLQNNPWQLKKVKWWSAREE